MLQCCILCLVIKNMDEAINLYVGVCDVYVLEKKQSFSGRILKKWVIFVACREGKWVVGG